MAIKKTKTQTGLRMDKKLWRQLHQSAKKERLSLNQETVRRIEDSFHRELLDTKLRRIEIMVEDTRKMSENILAFVLKGFWPDGTIMQKSSDIPAPVPDSCSSPSPH